MQGVFVKTDKIETSGGNFFCSTINYVIDEIAKTLETSYDASLMDEISSKVFDLFKYRWYAQFDILSNKIIEKIRYTWINTPEKVEQILDDFTQVLRGCWNKTQTEIKQVLDSFYIII